MSPNTLRTPPRVLLGFDHIHRYWEGRTEKWIAQVLPGEYFVTKSGEIITTVLGSCVSVCIRDTQIGVGGINHFMLPEAPVKGPTSGAARYGGFAIERLINDVLKYGGMRNRLEVKVFGGGKVIRGIGDIGASNLHFIRNYLSTEKMGIASEDVGGFVARRIRYNPVTGQALVKHLPMSEASTVVAEETKLSTKLKRGEAEVGGSVELF